MSNEYTEVEYSPLTECRLVRQRQGLSIIELAVLSKTSEGVVERLEKAEVFKDIQNLGIGQLQKVARALKVSGSTLYPGLTKVELPST